MNPRELRKAIKEGRWTAARGPKSLPVPPPEWTPRRRQRLQVAIRAASLFLFYGYEWTEIRQKMAAEEKLFAKKVSRARVQQYVDRGVQFLLTRDAFVEVMPASNVRHQKTGAETSPRAGK
jgi:hypothetical protein